MKRNSLLLSLLLGVSCVAVRSSAQEQPVTPPPPPPPGAVEVDESVGLPAFNLAITPGSLSLAQIHDVVVRASTGRGWTVQSDAPDRVVVSLDHHRHQATVTYMLSESAVNAYCAGVATNAKGTRQIPDEPRSWLNFLQGDITKGLEASAGRR